MRMPQSHQTCSPAAAANDESPFHLFNHIGADNRVVRLPAVAPGDESLDGPASLAWARAVPKKLPGTSPQQWRASLKGHLTSELTHSQFVNHQTYRT